MGIKTKRNLDCRREKMGDINWRFMDNGYGREYGLGTGDMETFLKHPLESLAREICQNSIDAQNKKGAVRVEFKRFEIVDVNKYPWHEGLKEEINRCYEYKKDSKKEGNALRLMKTIVEQPTLKCLRISDFNTTGLKGIENNKDDDTPYYNLAKGSGVSEKTGSEGGSKGIGKFASFVTSGINTVFYATKTVDNIDGYIGIANLRSRPIDNQEGLKTTGVGYFGSDQKNDPILGEVQLDDSFHRKAEEYGTDVYILGFKERKNWENTIIAKILESFMAAILYDYLQVNVDGVIVDKTTIQEIINNNDFSSGLGKRLYRDIKAQYELLSGGEGIYTKDFFVNENKISMFVKRHTSSNEKEATKQCVLIRYPYMKITYTSTSAYIPYSAVCVIHDGKLAQDLKLIENPQHTAWEIKRLDDDPDKKREIKNEDKELNNIITDYIKEVLNKSMSAKTDVEGAGEFLPAIDTGDELGGENNQNAQGTKFEISTPKINLPSKAKTLKINNNGKV
jgi:hypothetical protein